MTIQAKLKGGKIPAPFVLLMLDQSFLYILLILIRRDTHNPLKITIKGRKIVISDVGIEGSELIAL